MRIITITATMSLLLFNMVFLFKGKSRDAYNGFIGAHLPAPACWLMLGRADAVYTEDASAAFLLIVTSQVIEKFFDLLNNIDLFIWKYIASAPSSLEFVSPRFGQRFSKDRFKLIAHHG